MIKLYLVHPRVIDPDTMRPVPERARTEGHTIPRWTLYWRRRVKDGDMSLTPPATAPTPEEAP